MGERKRTAPSAARSDTASDARARRAGGTSEVPRPGCASVHTCIVPWLPISGPGRYDGPCSPRSPVSCSFSSRLPRRRGVPWGSGTSRGGEPTARTAVSGRSTGRPPRQPVSVCAAAARCLAHPQPRLPDGQRGPLHRPRRGGPGDAAARPRRRARVRRPGGARPDLAAGSALEAAQRGPGRRAALARRVVPGQAEAFWHQLARRLKGHPALVAYNPLEQRAAPRARLRVRGPGGEGLPEIGPRRRRGPRPTSTRSTAAWSPRSARSIPTRRSCSTGGSTPPRRGSRCSKPVEASGILYAFHLDDPGNTRPFA